MKSNRLAAGFATAILALSPLASWSAEPTMREIYTMAESGRVREAEQAMQQVLRDHPNSAKAHYVDAELLARAGRLSEARSQLEAARRLEPGLPFANANSVRQLERQLQLSTGTYDVERNDRAPASGGFPWGMVLLIGGAVLLVMAIMRARARRQSMLQPPYLPGTGPQPYGQPGYGPGYMPPGGGIGSGIVGGLATGAALGAGLVAGEALAHQFTDGDERRRILPEQNNADVNSNMGGDNFGISDGGSWDDSGFGGDAGGGDFGGGGSDWS